MLGRRAIAAMPVIGLSLVLAACGSSAAKPAAHHTGTTSSSPPPTSSASAFARSQTSRTTPSANRVSPQFVFTGQFHSVDDYQVQIHGLLERYVNGTEFVNLGGKWSKSTGAKTDPLAQVAQQMQGRLHVTGIKVTSQGSCEFAGRAGKKYSSGCIPLRTISPTARGQYPRSGYSSNGRMISPNRLTTGSPRFSKTSPCRHSCAPRSSVGASNSTTGSSKTSSGWTTSRGGVGPAGNTMSLWSPSLITSSFNPR